MLVDLSPAVGSEADKLRPALVVANDKAVQAAEVRQRGVITVLPITSNTERAFAFQVLLSSGALLACGLNVESKIQAEQIRSVDVRRIKSQLGILPEDLHDQVREAMALHLDI